MFRSVRITCRECDVQFNSAFGACPNCHMKPLPIWRQVIDRRWLLPLASGLVLQFLSQHARFEGGRAVEISRVTSISQFITGALVFAAVVALLQFGFDLVRIALRRKRDHRREARNHR